MLVRAPSRTDAASGRPPAERSIEEHLRLGVVNLDKPAGPSSHQVVAWLKLALAIRKAGHGGTLDPNVTGVLPVALLDATRVVRTLLEAPKEYVCVLELQKSVPQPRLRDALLEFHGPIWQTPPLKSAVKRQLRQRTIYEIQVLEVEDRRALFRVSCEAGTYIRKLCHDVGLVLGVGGHMLDLRRSRTGPFSEKGAVTLHDVKDAWHFWKDEGDEKELRRVVRPVEELVAHLPRVVARDSAIDAVCHGAPLMAPGLVEIDATTRAGSLAAIFTLKGELVSVARAALDARAAVDAKGGVVVDSGRVVMDPGTYPKGW
ncbi:MAG TPA: RNA-guided pseudouridylation complex pseudouridine synthase subunit Cbf5 [Candidatus Thermoplasmatota archaeon]|nr:RNA-guided pseudouridylation complex pseudouridine synthase subunit Cbf5 [Candidatus Thermoplasmatota archaeon]